MVKGRQGWGDTRKKNDTLQQVGHGSSRHSEQEKAQSEAYGGEKVPSNLEY